MLGDDHTPVGAHDRHRLGGPVVGLKLLDLLGRDVVELQTRPRRVEQVPGAGGRVGNGIHLAHDPVGEKVLLLRGEEIGRVEVEQRIALSDFGPEKVDVELLDPARDLDADVADRRLVVFDGPHGSYGLDQRTRNHRLDPNADVLGDNGINSDLAGELVGVELYQIHPADWAGTGLGQDDPGVHPAGVILQDGGVGGGLVPDGEGYHRPEACRGGCDS